MLVKSSEHKFVPGPNFKGGIGEFDMINLANDIKCTGVKMYSDGSLHPGSTAGYHRHEGTMELYYFTSGEGRMKEADCEYEVHPGDLSICYDGGYHSVVNIGSEPLKYMVLLLSTT